ncbi:MAG TPA: hypothetical protein VL295_05815 [Gemmatimonadales bacterium]|jgi:hypothetical protein|nr:hypothetical protein [Gemmatimonadales bacterium]
MRSAGRLAVLALIAACGGNAAEPAGDGVVRPLLPPRPVAIEYKAGAPARYTYLRADTLITTLPNGGLQQQVVERRLQLRWQVTASPEGMVLAVTVDSARVIGLPGDMGRSMADSARGSVIRARILPTGAVTLLEPVPANAVARTFATYLPWIVPMMPSGAREGTSWVDTLNSTMQFAVVDLAERTERTTTGELHGEGSVFTLQGAVTRDGVTPQLRIDGTGARWGRAELGPAGRLLSASGRDSVAMIASVQSIGQRVPILQVGGYSLTPLP